MTELVEGTVVGHLTELWRYPVKSMAPEPLDEAEVGWHGLAGGRRWAFIRDGLEQSGFPWLTLRQCPDMRLYRPSFVEPSEPDSSPTIVHTTSGIPYDVANPALATALFPAGARVVRQDRGTFDAFPISLISTETVERLGEIVEMPLDVRRFRPNLVMSTADGTPFFEDSLVGSTVRVGTARMRIDKRDGRCVVIAIDPDSGERTPSILKAVVTEREGCLGVYGSIVQPGQLAVGDAIVLETPVNDPARPTA